MSGVGGCRPGAACAQGHGALAASRPLPCTSSLRPDLLRDGHTPSRRGGPPGTAACARVPVGAREPAGHGCGPRGRPDAGRSVSSASHASFPHPRAMHAGPRQACHERPRLLAVKIQTPDCFVRVKKCMRGPGRLRGVTSAPAARTRLARRPRRSRRLRAAVLSLRTDEDTVNAEKFDNLSSSPPPKRVRNRAEYDCSFGEGLSRPLLP